jgi:membrane-associated protease RseP (regulator of RpoE activity)
MLAIGAITAIVVVAGGVVLADVLGGSSKHRPRPIASVPNPAASQTNPNGGSGLSQPPRATPPTQTTPLTQTTPSAQTPPGTQTSPGGSQTAPYPGGQTTPGGSQLGPGGNQAGPGGSVKPSTQPAVPTFANQPTVHWLGMQIVTSPTGAVVNTVQIGSEGDTAGFEPGDVIASVAGAQIDSARAVRAAVAHVPIGGRVAVEIARGSTLITIDVRMQGQPTLQP